MDELLTCTELAKSYRCGRVVLQKVSLRLATGEIVAITGNSGGGKSTLARILCGTTSPTGGQAAFLGQPLWSGRRYNTTVRPAIQLVAQQPLASLDPCQPVLAAVAEPLWHHRLVPSRAAARERAAELLGQVMLGSALYDRLPHALSGGQAQRVALARALSVQPRLIIADEATAMLDIPAQAQVVTLLRQLVEQRGISVLLISHDLALTQAVADRRYHLANGILTEIEGETTQ